MRELMARVADVLSRTSGLSWGPLDLPAGPAVDPRANKDN